MANELYDTLIELESLGGLTPETQPIYDELVSLGEIPASQLGMQAAQDAGVSPERTILGTAKDVGIAATKGAMGLVEGAVGAIDLIPRGGFDEEGKYGLQFGTVGKGLEENLGFKPAEAREILETGYSEAQKAAKGKFAEAEGFGGKLKAAALNSSVVGEAIIESAPAMIGGAVTARTLMRAIPAIPGWIAAAVGEGAVTAGTTAEGIRQQTEDGLMTAKQASLALTAGTLTSVFGAIGGKFATKLGIEDIDTLFANGITDSIAMKKGIAKSVLGGVFSEGVLEELPQSVQEQIMTNLALGDYAFTGIEDAAALGLLSGAAMGGGINVAKGTVQSLKKAEKKENVYKEALGFQPSELGKPALAGPTIAQQFAEGLPAAQEQESQEATQAKAEALMSQVGPMFEEQAPLAMEEETVAPEVVVEEEVAPEPAPVVVKKKPLVKKKKETVAKKPVVKKPVVKKEKVVAEKKVPTKKSKAGRPAMTTAEKESKKFVVGTKTDDGFPVVDKAGVVIQNFPKKKDAVLWVEGQGTTKSLEEAYKARKATDGPVNVANVKPQAMPKVIAKTIQDIPKSTKLPTVGSGHGRTYGKVWYPIEKSKDQTKSPFQMAVHKEGNRWAITWNGSKSVSDVVSKKYGLPLDEGNFKNQKDAQNRADEVIRSIVKAYKGESLVGDKITAGELDITKKDLKGRKFGNQNVVIRLKKSLMDYYPVRYEDRTVKVSRMPEYRVHTRFSDRLGQFTYWVQRKQDGTADRSFPMPFVQGKPTGKVPGKHTVVNDIDGVKTWLLNQIEQNGFYNALPSADETDLKARFNNLEFDEGTTPAKPRPVPEKVVTQKQREEAAGPTKAEVKKTEKSQEKFDAAYNKVEESYNKVESPSEEDQTRLDAIDTEAKELRNEKEGLVEAIEEGYNLSDLYQEIEDDNIVSPTRENIEAVDDELEGLRVESAAIKDKYSSKKQQLKTILDSAKRAFDVGDVESAYAQLAQSDTDIKVEKAFVAAPEAGTKSLDSQIKHQAAIKAASDETIETNLDGKLGYSQIHPQWSGTAAKQKSGKVIYSTVDNKNAVVQYWNGANGELTFAYVKRSPKGQGFVYTPVAKATAELHQAVKDFKKHYTETMKNVSPFAPGEVVTVSEGLSKKSTQFEAYTKAMLKLLKLDNIQVFVSYDSEVKGAKGDKNGLFGKYFQYREQSAHRKDALGTISKPAGETSKYVIQLKSGMNTTQTVRTFLHELGHIIFYEHFARTDSKTKSSIVADWNAWKNNMKIGKVTYTSYSDAMQALESSKQGDKVQARVEADLFTEWFANRVREQVIANERTGGNLAVQFFKKVATNLMDWAKQVMGISNKRDAVAAFLQSIVESKSLAEIGIDYMKETGWTQRSVQDAALEDPVHAKPEVDIKKTVTNYVKSQHIHKPGLRRDALSMINIDPTSTEAEFDNHMEEMLFDTDNYKELKQENMPWDWRAVNQFAQPYWVAKQFLSQGQKGFSHIFDTAINSKRQLHKTLAKSFKRLKPLFELKSAPDLYAINDVIHNLDQNPHMTKDLPFKFEMEMNETLGYETIKGLNTEHYTALKQFVMNDMKGSNLTEELADMYINLRKSLDEALMRVTNMLKDALERGEGDHNILKEMLNKQALGNLDNYFPHRRFGDTYIVGTDENGDTKVRFHFNNDIFAKLKGYNKLTNRQLAKKLGLFEDPENEKLNWSKPEPVDQAKLGNVFDTPIPIDAMNAMIEASIAGMELDENLDSKARESLNITMKKAVASQMNLGKWRNNFVKRQNISGYSKDFTDMKRVIQDYLTSVHGAINKMEAMRSFSKGMSKIDPKENPEEWKYADNYISTYFEMLPQWVSSWKKFAFSWYLGARASTAVLNATQNFLTGVNRLNIDTGLTNPTMAKWLLSATRNLTDEFGRKAAPIFGKKLTKPLKVLSAEEHRLVKRIFDDGDAQDQLIQDMRGQSLSGPMSGKIDTIVGKLGGFMSFVERHNRVSIAITAYRLATKGQITNAKTAANYGYEAGQKFDVESATKYAEDVIADSHWHYGKENLPKFFRDNPKLQTMYVFKSFPMNLMGMLREWGSHEGGKGWVGVLGVLAWAGMFGGLKGLPFEEEVDYIIKSTYGVNWKDELRIKLNKDGTLHESAIDMLYSGVPASVGIDLSGSIGVGFSGTQKLDPNKDIYQNALSFVEGTVGVPASFTKDMSDGYGYLVNQRDYRKGAEKLSPKFISAFLKAQRLKTQGLMSKKGFKVNYPFNMEPYKYDTKDSVIKTLGFTPMSESKMYDKMEVLRFKEGREKKVVEKLAIRVSNDSLTIEEAFKELAKLNKGVTTEDFINPKLLKEGIKSRMGSAKPDKTKLFRLIQIAKRYN